MNAPRLLLPLFIALAPACIAAAESWNVPKPASSDELRLAGMWGEAQGRSAARMSAAPLDEVDFILADLSLKQIPGRRFTSFSGDISGRWISVAAFLAPLYPEPFAEFPAIMAAIPGFQKNDGHFGADQELPVLDDRRDTPILWGNGRILIGLVEVYERTGNKAALDAAKKLGDYYIATDAVYNKVENLDFGGKYSNGFVTCYFSCIEGLAALGRVTGDKRYLDEVERIAELALTVKDYDGLHCHGRLTAVRGFVEIYAAGGKSRWLDAAERDWRKFMRQYRLPTGGFKESLHADCVRDEGCGQSDWLRLNLALWQRTGRGCYLDAAERCLKGHFIINQFPNGGAGHRIFHQIDAAPVAFRPDGEEAWWCCSEHWARASVDIARFAVTSTQEGLGINLAVDCDGTVDGPGGKWNVRLREIDDGLRITLESPAAIEAAVRIHRPAWAVDGAQIEKSAALAVKECDDSWLLDGTWNGTEEIVVHFPKKLRRESAPGNAGVLLRGHDLLAAHDEPANAWLTGTLGGVRPVVLWNSALPNRDGCVVVPASLVPKPDPKQPGQWKTLKLRPLRSVAGQPHKSAWFSFDLRETPAEQIRSLIVDGQ